VLSHKDLHIPLCSTKKDILGVPQILNHIPVFGVWSTMNRFSAIADNCAGRVHWIERFKFDMSIRRTKMTKRFSLALIALVALAMLILPASAAVNQIAQGGDVFIGEEGLDVTAAVGNFTQIAWFASGTTPATDTPNYIVAVGNA